MAEIPQLSPEIEQFFGHWVWVAVIMVAGFFFREAVINAIAGVRFYKSRDFNELDVIWIYNRVARITKIGMMKTTLIFYDRGTKMTIPNHELESQRMEKALPMADLSQLPTEDDPDGGLYKEGEEPTKKEMGEGLVE